MILPTLAVVKKKSLPRVAEKLLTRAPEHGRFSGVNALDKARLGQGDAVMVRRVARIVRSARTTADAARTLGIGERTLYRYLRTVPGLREEAGR